jgi:putative phosphoribosyl transferase
MSDAPVSRPREVQITLGAAVLNGTLEVLPGSRGLVLFVHGSGSSRFSSRNRAVARDLQTGGLSTLLFDLLSEDEERIDQITRELRFDIALLTQRVIGVTEWLKEQPETHDLSLGYFGASTGAAAALEAAAHFAHQGSEADRPGADRPVVNAVVSRGGRPDLAFEALARVMAPTLLIVGGEDDVVIELNRKAFARLDAIKDLKIVPGATHLFEEPGTLEEVSRLAREWFQRHLAI